MRFSLCRQFITNHAGTIPAGERWLIATIGVLTLLLVQSLMTESVEKAYARSTPSALSALGSDSVSTVAVLFRLDDCAGNIESLRHWNVGEDFRAVRVQGIVLGTSDDSAAIHEILGGTGIRYSIHGNSDVGVLRTLRSLGHVATPVAVVLDPLHQVRLIAPAGEATSRDKIRHILQYATTLAESGRQVPRPAAVPTF